MSKRPFLSLFVVCLVALLALPLSTGGPARAADATPPLILIVNGDLWAWTGASNPLKQLTTWGYNSDPVISPNGKYVAYKSLPQFAVDDLKINGGRSGVAPANLWALDLATGAGTRIADQPPDAAFAGAGKDEKYTSRPRPAWSPDSKFLAWGEMIGAKKDASGAFAGNWEQLIVYDWAKKTGRVVVKDLPGYQGLTDGTSVDWGAGGLLFLTPQGAPNTDADTVYIYSPEGKQLARYALSGDDCPCYSAHWIEDEAKALILVERDETATPPYLLLDPATGKKVTSTARLERYSLSAPDGVYLSRIGEAWFAAEPGKPALELTGLAGPEGVSISPDGKQLGFTRQSRIFVFSGGLVKEAALGAGKSPTDLAWGAVGWRLGRP